MNYLRMLVIIPVTLHCLGGCTSKRMVVKTDATKTETMDFLDGLTKANMEDLGDSETMIDGESIPLYLPNGERIRGKKMMDVLMSGEYDPEVRKIKHWSTSLSVNPNVSIVEPYWALNTKPVANIGYEVNIRKKVQDRRHFFSLGFLYNRNSFRKTDLINNGPAVDINGKIDESKTEQFKITSSLSYLSSKLDFNYELINNDRFRAGFSTGIMLKYYLKNKTKYNIPNENAYTVDYGIFNVNYIFDSPTLCLGLWYEQMLSKTWGLLIGTGYKYDFNYDPDFSGAKYPNARFHKIELRVGIIKNWIL